MKTIEFQTNIDKGILEIPEIYQKQLEKYKTVRVIIVTEENAPMDTDLIEYLMENPLKVEKILPLKRDEIYERK